MIRIIGVGNPLMGDDGVGVALVGRLAKAALPARVEVLDGGTGGVTLLPLMEGAEAVILVDAADMGLPPGAVVRLPGEEIHFHGAAQAFSLHQAGLEGALALGRELGILPPVVVFLVQGERVEPGIGLSLPVEAALGELEAGVTAEALRLAG